MSKVFVTGATGNVGAEVIKSLQKKKITTMAGAFSEEEVKRFPVGEAILFDFADSSTWGAALEGVDKVFLMRPPAISDVQKYLFPFIDHLLENGIKHIVFLSLQGVQFNFMTPHFKVEKYLKRRKAPYTFLRPNFFMQNLSTFYKKDIAENDTIFVPAGKGKTAFVDVRDIGEVAATVFSESEKHIKKAYTLSGSQAYDYYEIAQKMTGILGREIVYAEPTIKQYQQKLLQEGQNEDFVKVQKMLFFVVRHNLSKGTTDDVETLLGRKPISIDKFIQDNLEAWK